MKALWAVAKREMAERWLLVAGALLVGSLPWLLYFAARATGNAGPAGAAGNESDGFEFLLPALYTGMVALITGWSIVGRDLTEGRLSFFFARPIAWWAIWGGKLLAGAALTFLSGVVIWGLALPMNPKGFANVPAWLLDGSVALACVLGLIVMALAHVASVAYRSRSPLIALDLAALIALTSSGAAFSSPLVARGAIDVSGRANWWLAGLLSLVAVLVTAAGARQVALGRIDGRSGHHALSRTLWPGLGILLVALGLWSYREMHPSLEDLQGVLEVSAAPTGPWIDVLGWTSKTRSSAICGFLVDTSSGRTLRRGCLPPLPSSVGFSSDGQSAVWFDGQRTLGPTSSTWSRLLVARLDEATPSVREVPIRMPIGTSALSHQRMDARLTLSHDGSRLAVALDSMLDVFETTTGTHLAGIPSGGGTWWPPFTFDGTRSLRALRIVRPDGPYSPHPGALEIVDVDLESRSQVVLGRIPLAKGQFLRQAHADGRVLLASRALPGKDSELPSVLVHELPSGRLLAKYGDDESAVIDGLLLDEGRIALVGRSGTDEETTMELVAANGDRLWSRPCRARLVAQLSPAVISTVTHGKNKKVATVLIDIATGQEIVTLEGMHPRPDFFQDSAAQGAPQERILRSGERGLFVLDPANWKPKTILPPQP